MKNPNGPSIEEQEERADELSDQQRAWLDRKRLDWLDWFTQGDDSVTVCEEDGGVICSLNMRRVQNNYVGKNVRDAIDEAMKENQNPRA